MEDEGVAWATESFSYSVVKGHSALVERADEISRHWQAGRLPSARLLSVRSTLVLPVLFRFGSARESVAEIQEGRAVQAAPVAIAIDGHPKTLILKPGPPARLR